MHLPLKFIIFAKGKNAKVFFLFSFIGRGQTMKACKWSDNLSQITFWSASNQCVKWLALQINMRHIVPWNDADESIICCLRKNRTMQDNFYCNVFWLFFIIFWSEIKSQSKWNISAVRCTWKSYINRENEDNVEL